MPSDDAPPDDLLLRVFTPARRDALLVLIGVALITAPLWLPALGVGQPIYTYERAEVVYDDEVGLTYAGENGTPYDFAISNEIGCSTGAHGEVRTCSFERHLAQNNTVPTHMAGGGTGMLPYDRYRYVSLRSGVYETSFTVNESASISTGASPRIDLALEPVSPEKALRDVSVDPSSEPDDVPSVVAEAAREGTVRTRENVDVPQTPVRLDDGTYYRVYQDRKEPPTLGSLGPALPYVAALLGILLALPAILRFEVIHVSESDDT